MKYNELSNDISNETVAKRIELRNKEKEASVEHRKAKNKLDNIAHQIERLQEDCKHEDAVIKQGWQGGGIYYCYCSCPECGKEGGRYVPQYHMIKNNEWYASNIKHHITLEQAIKIGRTIGNSMFESSLWWGEVEDYDKLIRDTVWK